MLSEVYQERLLDAFFDTISGNNRDITRIYLCVVSLAKLRDESPAKLKHLVEQIQKSKQMHQLSIDILDYVIDVVKSLDNKSKFETAGITDGTTADDFGSISLDSL